jgi:hypothetical protein
MVKYIHLYKLQKRIERRLCGEQFPNQVVLTVDTPAKFHVIIVTFPPPPSPHPQSRLKGQSANCMPVKLSCGFE